MLNILCLEQKNELITKSQIFRAAVFLLVYSSNISPTKWSVILPIDTRNASYNKLISYTDKIEPAILDNFLNNNSLALLNIILSNNNKPQINNFMEVMPYLRTILLKTYSNLSIPDTIHHLDGFKYINLATNLILEELKTFYYNFIMT